MCCALCCNLFVHHAERRPASKIKTDYFYDGCVTFNDCLQHACYSTFIHVLPLYSNDSLFISFRIDCTILFLFQVNSSFSNNLNIVFVVRSNQLNIFSTIIILTCRNNEFCMPPTFAEPNISRPRIGLGGFLRICNSLHPPSQLRQLLSEGFTRTDIC